MQGLRPASRALQAIQAQMSASFEHSEPHASWTPPAVLETTDAGASVESFVFPLAPASPQSPLVSRPPLRRVSRPSGLSASQVRL